MRKKQLAKEPKKDGRKEKGKRERMREQRTRSNNDWVRRECETITMPQKPVMKILRFAI